MKHHIMIAFGLLLLIVFGIQLFNILINEDFGVRVVYALGGLVLAGWLIKSGIAEMRHAQKNTPESND